MPIQHNGKVQRSAAEWRALIARYEQSGLGMAGFCTQAGVALNSFKKRYSQRDRRTHPAEAFVDLTPGPVPAAPGWELELTLPNGVRLALRGTGRVE
ncbi:MAG: hypothetical protein AB1671_20430 [Thermodesulfobacteriota bacterium]|jgi:hypothetical protein